jgi:hypothetical protein
MPPVGFEPKISAGERPKTYALDRAAIGTGIPKTLCDINTQDMKVNNFFLPYFPV